MRLSNSIREVILNGMLEHRFGPPEKALEAEGFALGGRIYDTYYDQKTRRRIKRLPGGWLPTVLGVRVKIAGHAFEHDFGHPGEGKIRRVLEKDFERWRKAMCITIPRDPELLQALISHAQRETKLKEQRQSAHKTGWAALVSCSTTKKLLDTYPDLAPFVPEPEVVNLPAVPCETIVDLFDLPVKDA